jgi:tetratricopeptide (TPR) repeat protein
VNKCLDAALDRAVALHQTQRWDEAERAYRQILADHPGCADAHNLLAALLLGMHRPREAAQSAKQASELAPHMASYHFNYGHALRGLGQWPEARDAYQRVTLLQPTQARAWCWLGECLRELGEMDAAERACRQAMHLDPQDPDAWLKCALVVRARGDDVDEVLQQAIRGYEQQRAAAPHDVETLLSLGLAYLLAERYAAAAEAYLAALPRHAPDVMTLNNLGLALMNADQTAAALPHLQRAVALRPDFVDAHNNLGLVLQELGRLNEAIQCFKQAVALNPNYEKAWLNWGLGALEQEDYGQAEVCFRRVLALNPRASKAINGLGVVGLNTVNAGDDVAALRCFQAALSLDPENAEIHSNMGIVAFRAADFVRALHHFDEALRLKNDLPSARSNRALVHFMYRRYESAVADYEYRVMAALKQSYYHDPRDRSQLLPSPSSWMQDNVCGKRLLLLTEQGVGDQLFFLRFARLLREQGAHLTYWSPPRLIPLLEHHADLDRVVHFDEPAPDFDYALGIGDLPLISGFWRAGIEPPPLPLLASELARECALERLRDLPRPWIGATWRAGFVGKGVRYLDKRVPLPDFVEMFRHTPGTRILLQRKLEPEERALWLRHFPNTWDAGEYGADLAMLLGLLDVLDDYVTVSNTNVHLRASLGKGGRVLVPRPPEFRWLAEGDVSPWFPGYRVYRETADHAGSWREACAAVSASLIETWGGF